jgi:hypothetical protein
MSITFKNLLERTQEHSSAETSLNQVSAGLGHAVKHNLIKPNSIAVDYGGGKFDKGKEHVQSNIKNVDFHVHDVYNRSKEHNQNIEKYVNGNADYVGLHNVLNVIKEPHARHEVLQNAGAFMKRGGKLHVTVYEGDGKGKGRISKTDKGQGSSWQEHRKTSDYHQELKNTFPEHTHEINRTGKHFIITKK